MLSFFLKCFCTGAAVPDNARTLMQRLQALPNNRIDELLPHRRVPST